MILDNLLNFSKISFLICKVRVVTHLYSVLWELTNIMHISAWIGVSVQQMVAEVIIGGELVKGSSHQIRRRSKLLESLSVFLIFISLHIFLHK